MDPDRPAGALVYHDDYHVPQYCGGTEWVAMGPFPGAGGSGCTAPSAPEGRLYYHNDYSVYQYCDGSQWVAMGPVLDDVLDGLVGHWKLDDGTGSATAADSSGNGNDGTLTNMDAGTDWVKGMKGGALDFDGDDDFVDMGDQAELKMGSADFSITLWARGTWTADGAFAVQGSIFAGGKRYGLFPRSTGGVKFEIDDNVSDKKIHSAANYNDDAWHHLVGVRDGTNLRLFIDGVEDTNSPLDITGYGDLDDSRGFRIGAAFNEGSDVVSEYFEGRIDDVRIYNRALTSEEIEKIYFASQPINLESGLVGHWRLDESGNTAAALDASGQGNDGTLTNFPADPSANWVTGRVGGGLDFDGTDDVVDIGSPAMFDAILPGSVTLSAWIYPRSMGQSDAGKILDRNTTSGANANGGWHFRIGNTNTIEFSYGCGAGGADNLELRAANNAVSLNAWSHVTVTWDGSANASGAHIYVNGLETPYKTSDSCVGGFHDDDGVDLLIGNVTAQNRTFDGLLDDVRVYNRVLTEGEIKKLSQPPPDLENGLVGHWKMDDGTGSTTAADSAGSNDGTLTNMDPNTDWVTGPYGTALDFDGSNDYVGLGNVLNMGTSDFSISAWVKSVSTTAIPSGANGIVYKKSTGTCTAAGYQLTMTNGEVRFKIGDGTSCIEFYAGSGYNDGNWHHVTAVADRGTDIRLYADGVLIGTTAETTVGNIDSTNNLGIGALYTPSIYHPFDGQLDDVRIYNRVLTEEEIQKLANPIALESGLVGHWTLDESGNVSTAADSSGNGNEGTLTNFPADPSANWVVGRLGSALDFDGGDDYVDMGTPASLDITGTLTMAAWVHPDSANQSAFVVSKHNSNFRGSYELRIDNGDAYFKIYPNCVSGQFHNIVYPVPAGGWTHLAGIYDPSAAIRLYVNGELYDENTTSIAASNCNESHTFQLGYDPEASNFFDGLLDDVRVYNRVLNEDEIKFLSNPCQNPGHMPGTMLYNEDHSVLQYCNGQDWIGIGK